MGVWIVSGPGADGLVLANLPAKAAGQQTTTFTTLVAAGPVLQTRHSLPTRTLANTVVKVSVTAIVSRPILGAPKLGLVCCEWPRAQN